MAKLTHQEHLLLKANYDAKLPFTTIGRTWAEEQLVLQPEEDQALGGNTLTTLSKSPCAHHSTHNCDQLAEDGSIYCKNCSPKCSSLTAHLGGNMRE